MFKSGILNAWAKKTAVALHKAFYETLPPFEEVDKSEADLAWLIYDLKHHPQENKYILESENVIYTKFHMCVTRISTPEPGDIEVLDDHLLKLVLDRTGMMVITKPLDCFVSEADAMTEFAPGNQTGIRGKRTAFKIHIDFPITMGGESGLYSVLGM